MSDLQSLPNVGPKLAEALRDAGIKDPEELRSLGSVEAWRRIHPRFTCMHSLLALEGAVQGVPKRELSISTRTAIKEEASSWSNP